MERNLYLLIFLCAAFVMVSAPWAKLLVSLCMVANAVDIYRKYRRNRHDRNKSHESDF